MLSFLQDFDDRVYRYIIDLHVVGPSRKWWLKLLTAAAGISLHWSAFINLLSWYIAI